MTFALWRENGSEILNEVESSRYEVPARTLPPEQWLICEGEELNNGCEVQVKHGDWVGVVIDRNSSLRVVEVVEGEMVEGVREGLVMMKEDRWVNRSSLERQEGRLLVVALVGQLNTE